MRSVLVLRDDRGKPLVSRLRTAGFRADRVAPIRYQTTEWSPPARADWAVITSAQTVRAVSARWPEVNRVAAVGPATAAALRSAGLSVDFIPTVASGAGLAAQLPPGNGSTAWLPRSDLAGPELPDALRAKGYQVLAQVVYRTVCDQEAVAAQLAKASYEAIVAYSPSGVKALPLTAIPCFAVGEPTAKAITQAGLVLAGTAESPTDDAVLAAILQEKP